jgi:hypothetical protein
VQYWTSYRGKAGRLGKKRSHLKLELLNMLGEGIDPNAPEKKVGQNFKLLKK